jgi:hypothetical protein
MNPEPCFPAVAARTQDAGANGMRARRPASRQAPRRHPVTPCNAPMQTERTRRRIDIQLNQSIPIR